MKSTPLLAGLSLSLTLAVSAPLHAQDVLPFPPTRAALLRRLRRGHPRSWSWGSRGVEGVRAGAGKGAVVGEV